MSETLAALQARFAAGLLDGGDDPAGLFRGPVGLVSRRFALYRGNLTANWANALANAYPVLQMLVGEEFFHALARHYGRHHPSREGDLNRFGAGLADYLEDFEPLRDYPYMPDLARLEWALHLAHYAADTPALDFGELAALDPQRVENLRLGLRPGAALIASDWAIGEIWLAHQPEAACALPDNPACANRVLAWRPRWRVRARTLGAGEFAALAALGAGAALGAALEAGLAADAAFDPAISLPAWINDALLLPPAPPPEN